jgi:YHS domain-containing protein
MDFQTVLYFLVLAGLFLLMMRFGCGAHVMGHAHRNDDRSGRNSDARSAAPTKATDPVCGMSVDPGTAKTAIHAGHAYNFCSQECREKFETNPAPYTESNISAHHKEEHHGCC